MSSADSVDLRRRDELARLGERIGHSFAAPDGLDLALRHRSWCAEHGGRESNERLEFLGDAVLQLVTTELLFADDPVAPEGALAQRRAALVNTRVLADAGRTIGLGPLIRLGRGEASTGGADKDSILADATEALIGAVYLDGGLAAAAAVVHGLLADPLDGLAAGNDPGDPKSRLQELAARSLDSVPRYEVTDQGPDHAKEFAATVFVGLENLGSGQGRTKKDAEQAAAAEALAVLAERDRGSRP